MEILEQLQLKKTQVEHQITRLENRKNYLDKAERKARAHRLITKGAAIESIVPAAKDLPETVFYELMEKVFDVPAVQEILFSVIKKKEGGENV